MGRQHHLTIIFGLAWLLASSPWAQAQPQLSSGNKPGFRVLVLAEPGGHHIAFSRAAFRQAFTTILRNAILWAAGKQPVTGIPR